MNVLVAGATGAIGRPLIYALVSARHNVFGMTSSKLGLQTLKEDDAEGLLASALDAQAVDAAIKRARPEVVIDELTSLPKHYTPDEMRAAAERDHKLRLEGGQNVLNAARAAGARRYIIQSTGFYSFPASSSRKMPSSAAASLCFQKLRVVQIRGFSKITLSSLQAQVAVRDFIRLLTVELH
jgi:2-alkyl-3-oxoalkanoate reductase